MICVPAAEDDLNGVPFTCGQEAIDSYFKEKLFEDKDAVPYCFWTESDKQDLVGIASFSCAGIVVRSGDHFNITPAIEVKIFAVNEKYQHQIYADDDTGALHWSDYCLTDSNLNHTGIYLYSKGKIMIHLTFDYKTDEKCTTPGQYLKYHRTFQGLSTRELAEKVGIVPATLVLYENDRHPIKYSTAVALANVLGIDRNRLLDEYTAFVDYPYFSLLKKVRQDLSLTQIQMAELIGIGQTSYSGWEREIRVPRRKEYDKILAALKKLRVNVDTYLCQSASI